MILTPAEMQMAEQDVFDQGHVVPEDLMEKAGLGIARALHERWPRPGKAVVYLGKGHNAGDALVVGRHLRRWGWHVTLRDAVPPETASSLTRKKRAEFLAVPQILLGHLHGPHILMDGLLGIGAHGPLRKDYQKLAREINAKRVQEGAIVVAIDLPSGLDGESGAAAEDAVRADLTLTIAYAKTGLLADQAINHVGTLALIPLPEIPPPPDGRGDATAQVLTADLLSSWHQRRPVDHYKNRAGHVCLFAGSLGYTGAAALAAEAALNAGAGLVSLHVPEAIYPILATRCAPEIMVHSLPEETLSAERIAAAKGDVFAIGPGLGAAPASAYLQWLQTESRPIVIDADALNLIASTPNSLDTIASVGPRLLTPHPGEFTRLFPAVQADESTRRAKAERIVQNHPLTLLYKGARSIIAHRDTPTRYNLTGNPGMATGGMGDVLTGVCAGLAAQGHSFPKAASLASWLCGRAADLALCHDHTEETLRPTTVIEFLSAAFRDLTRQDPSS